MGFEYCKPCYGSGYLLGGGMMKVNCHHCDGTGNIFKVDKDSHRYKDAIKEIKATNKMLIDSQANEIFFQEFAKLEDEDKKKSDSVIAINDLEKRKSRGRPKAVTSDI